MCYPSYQANKMFIGQIISSLAGTWLQGRVDKAKAETEVKVARARAEAKVYETGPQVRC